MAEHQFKFPLLAIYPKQEVYEYKRVSRRSDARELEIVYVLPPMTAGQSEAMLPILRSVGRVIDDRLEQGYDPTYLSGAKILGSSYANIESAELKRARYGQYEGAEGLWFPAWTATIEILERSTPVLGDFESLLGVDVQIDTSSSDSPTYDELITAAVEFPDPSLISGLCLWLVGDEGITLASDGTSVSQWADQHTTANHAVQATGANQPQIHQKAFVVNGVSRSVVRFDGAASYLVSPVTQIANNSGKSFVALVRLFSASPRGTVLMQTATGDTGIASSGIQANVASTAGTQWGFFASNSTFDAAADTDTNWHIITVVESASTGTIASTVTYYVDGSPAALSTRSGGGSWSTMASSDKLALGALPTDLTNTTLAGDIGVVLAFNTALTSANRQLAEQYCRQWAGL